MKKQHSHIPRILLSKGLFFVLILFLLFVSVSMLREVKRKQQIQKDILALEHELVEVDANNSRLESLIDYLKTDEYAELESKKRLGMKKKGEEVLLITREEALEFESENRAEELNSNWKNWWNYFFN